MGTSTDNKKNKCKHKTIITNFSGMSITSEGIRISDKV